MTIEFDNNLPIYLQIMNYIKKEIVTGKLNAGDKIPSVRELAAELQINPNTVQRTFQELEREEVVETRRGLGRYVTSEEAKIMTIKKEMAGDLLNHFISGMQELGFTNKDIASIVAEAVEIESE
ncbi:MAG TPA: GntR family transcriptional regulator [Paenibacillus sp.]